MKYIITLMCLIVFAGQGLAQEDKAASQIDGMLNGFLSSGLSSGEMPQITEEQVAAVDDKILRYAYDVSVTEQIRGLWATIMVEGGATQTEADEHAKIFSTENTQQWVDEVFPDTGFRGDNIADVVAMEILLNIVIAQQLEGTPSEGDIAIRDTFKVSTANAGEFKNLADKDKQYFAESTMLKLILTLGSYGDSVRAGEDLGHYIERSTKELLRYNIDPAMVTVVETGIGFTPLMEDVIAGKLTMQEAFPNFFLKDISSSISSEVKETQVEEVKPTEPIITSNPLTTNPLNVNPLAVKQEASPFIGNFSGDGLSLTLKASTTGFSGELDFNGQVFPVEATDDTSNLNGTFGDSANSFPFKATLVGGNLNFDSQGNIFNLIKENANPLGN